MKLICAATDECNARIFMVFSAEGVLSEGCLGVYGRNDRGTGERLLCNLACVIVDWCVCSNVSGIKRMHKGQWPVG